MLSIGFPDGVLSCGRFVSDTAFVYYHSCKYPSRHFFTFFIFRPPEQALFPSQAVGFYCITLFQNLSTPFLIFFSSLFPVFSQLFFMSSKPLLSAYLQLRPKLPVPRVFSSLFILSGNAAFQKTFRSISAAFAVSLFFLYENARRFAPVGIRSF